MSKTITQQLSEIFHQVSAAYVGNMLTSEKDLAEFEAINRGTTDKQQALTRLYHEEYDMRVETARQRLYDKAGQLRLDHPAPPGVATNDEGSITRQAHREVQFAHESDLQATLDEAQQALEDLLDRAHGRNEVRGMARDAFARASDRRSGQDRRTLKHSQD